MIILKVNYFTKGKRVLGKKILYTEMNRMIQSIKLAIYQECGTDFSYAYKF